jgi:hypothetical protein
MAIDPAYAGSPVRRVINVDEEGNYIAPGGGGGGGGGSGLTDEELRASPVPVSRTPSKLETTTRLPVWASGQHVVVGAATAKTTAITGTEVMISLSSDAYVRIGTQASVVATKGAGSMFLKAGGPYTFQLTSGEGVAVIQDSAAGVMSVVPVA